MGESGAAARGLNSKSGGTGLFRPQSPNLILAVACFEV